MTTFQSARRSISAQNISDALKDLSSGGAPKEAPPRIRGAVDRYEAQSERIIGWIQLAGVLLFGTLYAATYGAFDVHHAIEPVPFALALYGGFTLWRLHRSYRARLTVRQQYVSAAIDIVLLMALIGSFPYQYGEPAALYLKAPTLFYAFLLIGLRALRFDPAQVVFTGFAAVIGWSILTLIAAANGAPMTGDYRIYMTSLSVLPGAELEKIAALVGFTLILALSVERARALLFRTATEEATSADLSKFVGRDAAEIIRASRDGVKAGDGEIRAAAIMFIDLRGFTPTTRNLPPQQVIGLLQEYQARFLPIIEGGGGSIDKFLGDGILVSFGAARPSRQECADAVRTALAAAEEGLRWKAERTAAGRPPLDIGIAIAAGDVVYGAVGHGERLEYTVIGDAVNLAAKLEKHAKAVLARALTTSEVVRKAADQGFAAPVVRTINGAEVAGVGAPVDLAVLA